MRIVPKENQICIVRFADNNGRECTQYARWETGYSIYGSGGHFALPGGAQLGLPCDVIEWYGTHWIAHQTDGVEIECQTIKETA